MPSIRRGRLRGRTPVRFGEKTGPVVRPPYAACRFIRVAGASPDSPDAYSPVQNGWVSPPNLSDAEQPNWMPLTGATWQASRKPRAIGEAIRAELAANNPAHLVLERQFRTQSADPVFLEPESGIAWYDPDRKNLELVIGVQSPYEAVESVAFLLGEAEADFRPTHINTQSAYVGGGFGGRDHTPFPLYVALAAMFFPGRPVRLANNRYEQFQSGIKRHALLHTHAHGGRSRDRQDLRAEPSRAWRVSSI